MKKIETDEVWLKRYRYYIKKYNYYHDLKYRILNENYTNFIKEYCQQFKADMVQLDEVIKEQSIEVGEEFFRARVGNDILEAAIDDLDILENIPYFGSAIEAPPSKFVKGGRFNREGISYLYLADNIETCISEIHLQVGQICSVAKFKCKKKGIYVLIEKNPLDKEQKDFYVFHDDLSLYDVLTKPVHSQIKEYYLVTQFFSDVFKTLGYDGLIFPSTQGTGKNIVSFSKRNFELIQYSEQMIQAKKISYEFDFVPDGYKKYSDYDKILNYGNVSEDEKREQKFEYIMSKIRFEKHEINGGNN